MKEQPKWENTEKIKLAAYVKKSEHHYIKSHLYHGQFTQLIRCFLESIVILIQEKKVVDIMKYVHKEQTLILPIKKIKLEAENVDATSKKE